MSLEEALTANTAAIVALTKLMGSAKITPAGAAAEKLIEETAGKAAAGKAATGKAVAGKTKALTIDTIKAKFGEFLGVEDKALRTTRKDEVRAMLEHFGVAKASDLESENWSDALKYLKQCEDGEQPDFMDEGAGDGDSESLV